MKKIVKTWVVVLATITLASCSKTDLYDEHAVENYAKSAYSEGFARTYPSVDLNQNWDFSTGEVTYSLPTSEAQTRALTRGAADRTKAEFLIEGSVPDYVHTNLKAGMNNKEKGNPFYMEVPSNAFTIVPIFQGTASYVWELWMYVEGVGDIKVWSKGEDLSYKKTENSNWTAVGNGAVPDNVYQVKSAAYTYGSLPKGNKMYFYLKVTQPKLAKVNSSLEQMMLTMDNIPRPANVPEDNDVMIVGCEDNPNGDWDYEDVVFLVYGKPVPPMKKVKTRNTSEGKRYMVEDLGSTDDFDFNDIVVDVVKRTKETLHYTIDADGNEKFTGQVDKETLPAVAQIRAMGGTLDFTLKVGNTSWTKSSAFNVGTMYNTTNIDSGKVLAEFVVSGWDENANNVSVTVNSKDGNVMNIPFPKVGEAPMIIATNISVPWMNERVSIPESWWSE